MRTLIAWLVDVRGHHRLTVDPAAENRPRRPRLRESRLQAGRGAQAVRAVEDGVWRDALLMELLAGDFRR